jgi:hypothetical protein
VGATRQRGACELSVGVIGTDEVDAGFSFMGHGKVILAQAQMTFPPSFIIPIFYYFLSYFLF